MASVSVLYLEDSVVGPHLELLRNICEPGSKSRPHVTVRFFERLSMPEDYKTATIGHIDIVEPGSFGLDAKTENINRTVFLRCKSDDLVPLEFKPHFPTSEFHITIYDGKSKEFARNLLRILKRFRWAFRVPLPHGTTLTTIPIKPRKPRPKQVARDYSPQLQQLFHSATAEHLDWERISTLGDKEKLILATKVCKHLQQFTTSLKKLRHGIEEAPSLNRVTYPGHKTEPEVHLTPPELAQEITKYAVSLVKPNDTQIHFGDPAVGTGAFYSALIQTLDPKKIASAIGIDISQKQVEAAKMRWSHRGMTVKHGDYLHMDQLSPRTLILANPPYLRHQGIPKKYKHELRDRASIIAGRKISGLSGLYVYFMLLSHAWMKPAAIAAWLIPSEFMQTSYGSALRHYLTHKVQLIRIHQFSHDDQKFENVKVLPSVVVFRNILPDQHNAVLLSKGGTIFNSEHVQKISLNELGHDKKWSIPLHSTRSHDSSDIYIRDIFTVRRGIATGANEFFVLGRDDARRRGISKTFLRPILPKARMLENDVVGRAPDGYPLTKPQLCLLDCSLPLDVIKTRFPQLLEYLESAEDNIRQRHLVRHRNPWYKQESRDPAIFLCTYMGRSRENGSPVRFIWNKSDAIVTNTYLMLYPRGALARLLQEQPGIEKDLFELLQETARESMKVNWRVHAGGLYKIEPGDLLNVRLASRPQWLVDVVDPKLSTGSNHFYD